jgi:ubiquinone/menaquinone biosynthesis C-methylase UbiE
MSDLKITGIDINKTMIDEARESVLNKNVYFEYQNSKAPLPYADNQFDVVTFCSVLFLVDDSIKANLISEALRVLKPKGRIIILTASGKKSILTSFIEVWRYPFSVNNFTFIIWKIATTIGGRLWEKRKWLERYKAQKELMYTSSLSFNNNATIEIIYK